MSNRRPRREVNGLARARFSQDAVREFRVITNRFDPEIGGSAGGAMSIITKSGTNAIDGSVFGFFRDSSLREKGALDLKKNNDYSRHQLGFTAGGPIVKDKAFFFGSLEQINENSQEAHARSRRYDRGSRTRRAGVRPQWHEQAGRHAGRRRPHVP